MEVPSLILTLESQLRNLFILSVNMSFRLEFLSIEKGGKFIKINNKNMSIKSLITM